MLLLNRPFNMAPSSRDIPSLEMYPPLGSLSFLSFAVSFMT